MASASRKTMHPEHFLGPDRRVALRANGAEGTRVLVRCFVLKRVGLLRYIPLKILVVCHVVLGIGVGLKVRMASMSVTVHARTESGMGEGFGLHNLSECELLLEIGTDEQPTCK